MANAELKTKATTASVEKFLDSIPDEGRREDCRAVAEIMRKATGAAPRMWGTSVVGFGDYHYKYESGRENDWFIAGFSPRKDSLTLYFMTGIEPYAAILKQLGKHKTGKGCLYIKSLEDVDRKVLRQLVETSVKDLEKKKRA
jgi:hypothetical protein